MDAILAFHSIDDSGSVLSYSPGAFARLCDDLLADGVRIVPLAELVSGSAAGGDAAATAARAPAEKPRVALTFDDGMRSVHRHALPVLAARRLPFTVFVVSGWLGRDNCWPGQSAGIARLELMGEGELAELQAAGGELGDHTANHVRLEGLDGPALARELDASRDALAQRFGRPVTSFAYPYGAFDAATLAAVRRGYARAVTTRLAYLPAAAARDAHRLPRLETWYLREPARHRPLFGARTRGWLALRALLRRAKGSVYGDGA